MTAIHSADDATEPQAIFSHPLVRALDKPIKRARTGLFYQAGLLLVLVMMLLLPLLYLSLVAGVGYLVYLHAINDTFIISGHGRIALLTLFLYLAPILAGVILIIFMIKPLFARRRVLSTPLSVDEKEQPLLHAFVRKLADVVQAPRPSRIDIDCDVNASASFEGGILAFFRRDLILTIGLPLVSGLNAQQFTAVLAHELGHFAQGGGMRLTYLVRRLNAWFARIVYERDSIDDALAGALHGESHWMIQLVAALAIFFVKISRLILKMLLFIAHGVSSFMLRQMEYDADRCAARVAGSNAAIETSERVPLIGVASQAAFSDLADAWREQRLADDLPLLVQSREVSMPAEVRLTVNKASCEGKTRWFDSHPSNSDRIKQLRKEDSAGMFKFDAPAIQMFKNYDDLSRRATVAFYHARLGGRLKPEQLVATSGLVEKQGKSKEGFESLNRYFQGLIHPLRPTFIERSITRISDPSAAGELLMDLRTQFLAALPAAKEAANEFSEADERILLLTKYRELKAVGARKLNPSDFKLIRGDDDEVYRSIRNARQRRDAAFSTLDGALAVGAKRLEVALAIEQGRSKPGTIPEVSEEDDFGEYELTSEPKQGSADAVRDALFGLRSSAGAMEDLRQNVMALAALLSQCRPSNNSEQLIRLVLAKTKKVVAAMTQIQQSLRGVPYPYSPAGESMTMAQYLIKHLPGHEAVTDVYQAADSTLDGAYSIYMRMLSDLCTEAERVENDLGFTAF